LTKNPKKPKNRHFSAFLRVLKTPFFKPKFHNLQEFIKKIIKKLKPSKIFKKFTQKIKI